MAKQLKTTKHLREDDENWGQSFYHSQALFKGVKGVKTNSFHRHLSDKIVKIINKNSLPFQLNFDLDNGIQHVVKTNNK